MISERFISLAKAAGYGYLLAALGSICVVVVIASICLIAGVHAFTLSLGPIPFMREWSDSSGWGFESGWGIGISGVVGAIVGTALAWRRRIDEPRPI